MNCRTCGYPLWNLPGRACPECGAAFVPSDFVFPPGGVRYCCPHCDQQYFGTDPAGHLVPTQFACVSCGQQVAMNEMTLRPAGQASAVSGGHVERPEMPWFEREKHGAIKAWFKTVGQAMSAPSSLIKAVPTETTSGDAFLFVLANLTIFFIVGSLPSVLISIGLRGRVAAAAGFGGWAEVSLSLASLLVNLAAFLVWSVVTHAALRLLGGTSEPSRRTFHALAYASAAGALMAIPFGCGTAPGAIWWMVAGILMLATVQRCSVGKATTAALLGGLVAVLLPVGLSVAMIVHSFGTAGRARFTTRGGAFAVAGQGSAPLAEALASWGSTHGSWPDHALRLESSGSQGTLPITAFSASATQVPRGVPLELIVGVDSEEEADALVDLAAAALPPDVIGHRVGDWMFVYHGMPAEQGGILWTAVLAPKRDAAPDSGSAVEPAPETTPPGSMPPVVESPIRASEQTFRVLDQNGRALDLPLSAWPTLIQAQNMSRAIEGLPFLPTSYDAWRSMDLIVPPPATR